MPCSPLVCRKSRSYDESLVVDTTDKELSSFRSGSKGYLGTTGSCEVKCAPVIAWDQGEAVPTQNVFARADMRARAANKPLKYIQDHTRQQSKELYRHSFSHGRLLTGSCCQLHRCDRAISGLIQRAHAFDGNPYKSPHNQSRAGRELHLNDCLPSWDQGRTPIGGL